MERNELKKEYLDENTFWHITNKINLENVEKNGLIPSDGNRNGKSVSNEDKEPRVFFSQGLEAVLEQANNLGRIINEQLKRIKITHNGSKGKNAGQRLESLYNNIKKGNFDKNKYLNGGFIDSCNFLFDEDSTISDMFPEGLAPDVDYDKLTYDIYKTLCENFICFKGNLKEGEDYSYKTDYNYDREGKKKLPMTKKNMHAFRGHTILPEKLELMSERDGKPLTVWDTYKKMAEQYRVLHPEKSYLPVDEWDSWTDSKGVVHKLDEIHHERDYLSEFIEREKEEKSIGTNGYSMKDIVSNAIEKGTTKENIKNAEKIEEINKSNNKTIENF